MMLLYIDIICLYSILCKPLDPIISAIMHMSIDQSTGPETTYYDIHSWRQLILSSPELFMAYIFQLPMVPGQSSSTHPEMLIGLILCRQLQLLSSSVQEFCHIQTILFYSNLLRLLVFQVSIFLCQYLRLTTPQSIILLPWTSSKNLC